METLTLPWRDVWCQLTTLPLSQDKRDLVASWLPIELQKAANKRQEEFLGARWCAMAAMRRAGVELTSLPRQSSGAPQWPSGWSGSLAHIDTHAIAVVTPHSPRGFLGVDIEHWIDEKKALEILPTIATDQEIAELARPGLTYKNDVTKIFSAKEALYKALHPMIGEFIDFKEVEWDGGGRLRLLSQKSQLQPWVGEYPVLFWESETFVVSIVYNSVPPLRP